MTSEVEQTLGVCHRQEIVLNTFWPGSISPSLDEKKKKMRLLGMTGAITNKYFAGCK